MPASLRSFLLLLRLLISPMMKREEEERDEEDADRPHRSEERGEGDAAGFKPHLGTLHPSFIEERRRCL